MRTQITTLIALFLVCYSILGAQIEGDNLFAEDQIVKIELDFAQTSFWDSLVLNYETETYMKGDLTLTDLTGSYTFPDVGVRLKGNSSYGHPGNKKSFKIDFNKYVTGQNYDGLKKLNLSNGFKDPSMMREKVFFDVSLAANIPCPRANFANVYFNGELWGFYTLVEQIDDQFLDWAILDDDGNLFKAGANFGGGPAGGGNAADLLYYGPDQTNYAERYDLKSNEEEDDWTDLIALTDFINNSSATDFENNLGDHLEVDEYLRSLALDNLFANLDSYTGSARNWYIYHNLTTDKWEWIKWDANETFGSYGGGGGGPGGPGGGATDMTELALDHHDADRPLIENIFNSPILYAQYEKELCLLTEDLFNSTYMDAKIDKLKNMIQESVYADDNKMYTDANFDTNVESNITAGGGSPGGGTTYGLKSFVADRHAFVTSELDCATITSTDHLTALKASVSPNPFDATVRFVFEADQIASIKIYNTLGMQVFEQAVQGQSQLELQLPFLDAGIYFAELNVKDSAVKRSVILKMIKS